MATKTSIPSTPPPAPSPSNAFFGWMRGLGITRDPGWIGGVCSGVAARLGIDPIIVRGIAVVVAILGGPALLLYAAAWLLLPDVDNRIHLERLFRGEFYGALAGIGALFLLAVLPFSQGFWFTGPWFWDGPYWGTTVFRALWAFAVVGGLIWFIVWLTTRSRASGMPLPGTPASGTPTSGAPASGTATPGTATPGTATSGHSASFSAAGAAPVPPPGPPVAPADPVDPDALAAWKVQQSAWRTEHAAWRAQQSESARAASLDQRRLRNEQHTQYRQERDAQERRTRSNPLFSAIAIGVALIAGAATTLVVGDGDWNNAVVFTGLAVTLGVLGLAIVLNGFSGRRSGGASGLASVVAIILVLSPLSGWGPSASAGGTTEWSPNFTSDSSTYRMVVNSDVNLDLTAALPASAKDAKGENDRKVRLWLVDGDVNVTVPRDATVELRVYGVDGSVTIDGVRSGGGEFHGTKETIKSLSGPGADSIYLTIWIVSGTIDINHETNGTKP